MAQSNSQNPNADRQGGELLPTMLFVGAVLSLFIGLAWYFYSPYIAWGVTQSAIHTRYLLYPFTLFMSPDYADFIMNMDHHLSQTMDYSNAQAGDVYFLYTITMRSFSIIIGPLLAWRAISNLVFARTKAFTRVLNLKQLAEIQSLRYPRIRPAVKANLLEKDHRLGPWATSRNPLPYLIHSGVISDIPSEESTFLELKRFDTMSEMEQLDSLDHYYGRLAVDVKKLREVLFDQIGEPVSYNQSGMIDINKLGKIERTMAIIFLAALTKKRIIRKKIDALLDQLGASFEEGQGNKPHAIDLSGIEDLWLEIKEDMNVKKALYTASKRHAYWTTFFTYLYEQVYEVYGNMISRDFIFLKPINRKLYLLCNQVGLESARAECCAIREHYELEEKQQYPLVKKKVEKVMIELISDIQEEGWFATDYVSTSTLEDQLKTYTDACASDLQEFSSDTQQSTAASS